VNPSKKSKGKGAWTGEGKGSLKEEGKTEEGGCRGNGWRWRKLTHIRQKKKVDSLNFFFDQISFI
jgi:hypothetical protein